MKITIKDNDNSKELLKALKNIGKSRINVGVLGGDSELSMIAAVHEFGITIDVTPKMRAWFAYNGYPLKSTTTQIVIPERSFLRSGFDENIDKIEKKVKELLPSVLENNVDPEIFMDAIGQEFADRIADKIEELKSPPNSAMTIERKGSSNPLIDSGRLHGSIDYEVK